MVMGAIMAPLITLGVLLAGIHVIAPLLGVAASTGIFITHTVVTAVFAALGIREYRNSESGWTGFKTCSYGYAPDYFWNRKRL